MRFVRRFAQRWPAAVTALFAATLTVQQAAFADRPYVFQEESHEQRKIVCMEAEHFASLGTGRVACVAHASGGRILYSSDEVREHKEGLVASYRLPS